MITKDIIYNEDCYVGLKKIPDKSVDLVYIDIPYLLDNHGGGKSELAKRRAKNQCELVGIEYDQEKTISENSYKANDVKSINNSSDITSGINYSIFDELCRIMKHIHIYIWCSKNQILDIMEYFKDKNCTNDLLVWCKTNPVPTGHNKFLSDLEYCLFFKERSGVKLNDGYELKSKWYVSPINKKDKKLYDHPTIKPLDLVKRHILHSTQPNDVVLDCFMGSGTTAVACIETNRHYIGFEINKHYWEVSMNRIASITKKSVQEDTKNLFDYL